MIPRLWYISDGTRGTNGRPLIEVLDRALCGGLEAVVLRERQLETAQWVELLEAITPLRKRGLRVLISRRLDLARAFDLDGVQLAADAVPVAEARAWLGAQTWLGYSAHSVEEARAVARAGADYVMLSPIFQTDSKPSASPRGLDWLRSATEQLEVPVLALGGVTPGQTQGILKAGAWGVASVSSLGAAPDPSSAAAAFRREIQETLG